MKKTDILVSAVIKVILTVVIWAIMVWYPSTAYAKTVKKIQITNISSGYVLPVKKSVTLKVSTSPKVAKNKLKFMSSNSKIVKVNQLGKIYGKKKGSAYITVLAKDKGRKKLRIKIIVGKRISKLSLKKKPAGKRMTEGSTFQMKAAISPSNASNKKLKWISSNPKVLSVSSSGKLSAKKAGTATITVKAKDGSGKSAKCQVKVLSKVSSITVSGGNIYPYLKIGDYVVLKAAVSPSNSNQTVNWSSSDPKIATVDSKGKVVARSNGNVVITASAADGSGKSGFYSLSIVSLTCESALFIAHRGYSAMAPENSLSAFRLAVDNRFGGAECDIYRTKDGLYVISHDNNLKRIFGVDKLITASNYDEIKALTAVSGSNASVYPHEKLLTLDDYMTLMQKSNLRAVIELKETYSQSVANEIYDRISSYGINERVDIISFKSTTLLHISEAIATYEKRHSDEDTTDKDVEPDTVADLTPSEPVPPEPEITFLSGDPSKIEADLGNMTAAQWAATHGYNLTVSYNTLTESVVKQIHGAGKKIGVYTVNTFNLAFEYITNWGVDSITSNVILFQ